MGQTGKLNAKGLGKRFHRPEREQMPTAVKSSANLKRKRTEEVVGLRAKQHGAKVEKMVRKVSAKQPKPANKFVSKRRR